MKVLFLDESGDHSLNVIDAQYPVFVLGGAIVDLEYAKTELEQQLAQFKLKLFGRTDLILHTADIARNRNGFERLSDPAFRQLFYDRLNTLMSSLEYKVVACAIEKEEHLSRYGMEALDPYLLSLNILVERFCFEVGDVRHGGVIVAEQRNPMLDHQLELAWLQLRVSGTHYLQGAQIEKRVRDLLIRPKDQNIAGLQLADLVVGPIGRFVLGKSSHEDFRIIESKFRRGPRGAGYMGTGLVILPKQ